MQVSGLDDGHDVVNGIVGSDVAMVGGQLFRKHLAVAGAEPIHACTNSVNTVTYSSVYIGWESWNRGRYGVYSYPGRK